MAKKKRTGLPQRGKNAYAAELTRKRALGYEIVSDWTAQLCLDTLAMVLNDPDVMGRDAFGAKRLMRICEAFNEKYAVTKLALRDHEDSDYIRAKIDQAQAKIFGPDYLHWQDRYPYWDERDTY